MRCEQNGNSGSLIHFGLISKMISCSSIQYTLRVPSPGSVPQAGFPSEHVSVAVSHFAKNAVFFCIFTLFCLLMQLPKKETVMNRMINFILVCN